MAFNLSTLRAQNTSALNRIRFYNTTDSLATVLASGYFTPAASFLNTGDIINYYDTANNITRFLSVVNTNGVITTQQIGGGAVMLARGNTQLVRSSVNGAGDATFASLVDVTIPAGLIGANGIVRVYYTFTYTNSANTKNLRVAFGSGNYAASLAVTTTASASGMIMIANRNSVSSQTCSASATTSGFTGGSSSNPQTFTVDTSAAVTLSIGCNWGGATSSEAINLEQYLVEVIPSA